MSLIPDTNEDLTQYVLNREGLAQLTTEIFTQVNARIEERITSTVSDNSSNKQVPGALTVYNAIKDVNKIKNLTIASGNVADATITPAQNVLYVVRKSTTSTEANLYIWLEGTGYISIGCNSEEGAGSAGSDLTVMPSELISQIVSESYQATKPSI